MEYAGNCGGGITIKSPVTLLETDFDYLYIASGPVGLESIYRQCREELKIPANKILRTWSDMMLTDPMIPELHYGHRVRFVEAFAVHVHQRCIEGNVAELGVYQGDLAKEINRVFPDRKLYLFDTFEGFDKRDYIEEREKNAYFNRDDGIFSIVKLDDTAVDIVAGKLPNPDQCFIKKGYFPDTFDIENEMFCFVNIDTDLYAPTKAGLERFYPRMSRGGAILIHDYQGSLNGVTMAVDEFIRENRLVAMPIGDYLSVAVIKN
ncbi:hypothetical protein AGMMS50276_14530 [Synergistales bacterium]|nr:hypothetical protein AGMMS50276_14530 [Synergistales bacterium]